MPGFTLIELLVVLTVVMIIAVGGGLYLYQLNRSKDLEATVEIIKATLRDAQQRAINQVDGNYWGVKFENLSGRDRYQLFSSDDANLTSITVAGVRYLKSSLGFFSPSDDNSSIILFSKITGNLVSASCPSTSANSEISVGTAGGAESANLKVYCNGTIE